jgi:hypothetical protein
LLGGLYPPKHILAFRVNADDPLVGQDEHGGHGQEKYQDGEADCDNHQHKGKKQQCEYHSESKDDKEPHTIACRFVMR